MRSVWDWTLAFEPWLPWGNAWGRDQRSPVLDHWASSRRLFSPAMECGTCTITWKANKNLWNNVYATLKTDLLMHIVPYWRQIVPPSSPLLDQSLRGFPPQFPFHCRTRMRHQCACNQPWLPFLQRLRPLQDLPVKIVQNTDRHKTYSWPWLTHMNGETWI